MHPRLFILAAYCIALAPAASAQPAQSVRSAAVGEHIDWSFERDSTPVRYRVGEVELTIRGERDSDFPDLVRPVLTVALPGHAPVQAHGSHTSEGFNHRVTVGRWDPERPYVLFQSFSGGAHCCNQMQVVYPENGRLRLVDLGEWDGGYWDELPTDRNGDGLIDFVFVDNAFLYAFASYAESWAPPVIYNVVDGEPVDVSFRFSRDPGFRSLYEEEMSRARQACLHPEDGASRNGACAAYVASAARVGRFDAAWAEMLQAYDRNSSWPLPADCRVALVDHQCPEGQSIEHANYPDALRAFLIQQGYLVRSRAVRFQ